MACCGRKNNFKAKVSRAKAKKNEKPSLKEASTVNGVPFANIPDESLKPRQLRIKTRALRVQERNRRSEAKSKRNAQRNKRLIAEESKRKNI